ENEDRARVGNLERGNDGREDSNKRADDRNNVGEGRYNGEGEWVRDPGNQKDDERIHADDQRRYELAAQVTADDRNQAAREPFGVAQLVVGDELAEEAHELRHVDKQVSGNRHDRYEGHGEVDCALGVVDGSPARDELVPIDFAGALLELDVNTKAREELLD